MQGRLIQKCSHRATQAHIFFEIFNNTEGVRLKDAETRSLFEETGVEHSRSGLNDSVYQRRLREASIFSA